MLTKLHSMNLLATAPAARVIADDLILLVCAVCRFFEAQYVKILVTIIIMSYFHCLTLHIILLLPPPPPPPPGGYIILLLLLLPPGGYGFAFISRITRKVVVGF